MSIKWKALNILAWFLLTLIFLVIPCNHQFLYKAGLFLGFIFGTTNYCLILFRGDALSPRDIFSAGTAMAVADQYEFVLTYAWLMCVVLMFVMFILIDGVGDAGFLDVSYGKKAVTAIRSFAALAMFLAGVIFFTKADINTLTGLEFFNFKPLSTYYSKGFVFTFAEYYQRSVIKVPGGYSADHVRELLGADEKSSGIEREHPTVITIMNESFCDLSDLGPIDSKRERLSFFYSLKDDPGTIQYGKAYVSTTGGNTAKSEYEFLTGYSMANLPDLVPYDTLDFSGVHTFVKDYDLYDYFSLGMHPDKGSNWNREKVYPQMGFEKSLFDEAFEGKDTFRNIISDRSDYEVVLEEIDRYNDNIFLFNVTEQNHGGYTYPVEGSGKDQDTELPLVEKEDYLADEDVHVYESLIEQSDKALEYLISRLREYDRDVILVFFGDHQMRLNGAFTDSLVASGTKADDTEEEMAQRRYIVPYFIWTNYGLEESLDVFKDEEDENITSANYLGAMTAYYSGIENGYIDYLLNLRKKIPVINAIGYLGDDGEWYFFETETGYSDMLNDYKSVQYYQMFEGKRNKKAR